MQATIELNEIVGRAMASYLERRSFSDMIFLTKRIILRLQRIPLEARDTANFQKLVETIYFVLLSQSSRAPPSLHHIAVEFYRNGSADGLLHLNSSLSLYGIEKCSTLVELLSSVGKAISVERNVGNVVDWVVEGGKGTPSTSFMPLPVFPIVSLPHFAYELDIDQSMSVMTKLEGNLGIFQMEDDSKIASERIQSVFSYAGDNKGLLSLASFSILSDYLRLTQKHYEELEDKAEIKAIILEIVRLCVGTISDGMDILGTSDMENSEAAGEETRRVATRGTSKSLDVECIVSECFNILIIVTGIDRKFFDTNAFQAVKKSFFRLASGNSTSLYTATRGLEILLANYSTYQLSLDISSALNTYFTRCANDVFRDFNTTAAYEMINFCQKKAKFLVQEHSSGIEKSFFPLIMGSCILDAFLVDEIAVLLPLLMSSGTIVEIFNRILDMPYQALLRDKKELWKEESLKDYLDYLFNPKAGSEIPHLKDDVRGNTKIMKLLKFSQLDHTPTSSAALFLLNVYFEYLYAENEEQLAKILPVLVKRYDLMSLNPSIYSFRVQSQLMRAFARIIKSYPSLLMGIKSEVVRHLNPPVQVGSSLLVYHMCWAIGEVGSVSNSAEAILSLMEPLETFVLELLAGLKDYKLYLSEREYYEKLFTVCVFSLARCGASVMDISPRAILLIQKISRSTCVSAAVSEAASEVVDVLSKSGMSSVLLRDEIPRITDPTTTIAGYMHTQSMKSDRMYIFDEFSSI